MSERLIATLGVAMLAVAAGCTGTSTGTPTAATTSSTTESTGSPSTTVPLPPRPEDLSLDGWDPCTALTNEQQTALGFDGPPNLVDDLEVPDVDRAPGCDFSRFLGDPSYGYLIFHPIGRDLDYWFTGPEVGRAIPTEIGGFPAVQYGSTNPYENPDNERSPWCTVAVGVADNQQFAVQFSFSEPDDSSGLDAKCERAREVAEMVLGNLRANG